ncbi:BatA domain-containing protein [Fulvivirgaceae bacterium BMA10]|uniref:BatA domain-containing protein n=1 Tax=Splendidivirga corallicola TaxID=3051826 RepID=A0ABT8KNN6_9BACT|nr:BatA domain-containing protein [Fulvivirgaceae bacterium BMA10]
MFQLINPIYLFGLLALAVPVAIHLWNRKEGNVIKIASVELLEERETPRSSNVKLNQILLFVLRLLILIFLTLIIVEIRFGKTIKAMEENTLVLVEPDLLSHEKVLQVLDSLNNSGMEVRLITNDLSLWDPEMPIPKIDNQQNHWSILKEANLQADQRDRIIMITSSELSNFDGRRPEIATEIVWMDYHNNHTTVSPIEAHIVGSDSISFTIAESDFQGTSLKRLVETRYNSQDIPGLPGLTIDDGFVSVEGKNKLTRVDSLKNIQVVIGYSAEYRAYNLRLLAALETANHFLPENIVIDNRIIDDHFSLKNTQADALFLLSDEPPAFERNEQNQKLILLNPNKEEITGEIITASDQQKNLYYLAPKADYSKLPLQLIKLFSSTNVLKTVNWDQRGIDETQKQVIVSSDLSEDTDKAIWASLNPYFWVVLLLLIIGERWVAHIKKS